MPELADTFSSVLGGVIKAVEDSEQRHLLAQVDALAKAEGKPPTADTVLKAFHEGWSPDYFVGAELQIAAQLVVTTGKERTIQAGGSAALGPLSVTGTVTDTFRQAEQTNLSVNCTLKRQSRNAGLSYALTQLGLESGPAAAVPTGPAAPPTPLLH